jgi:hypothetical protein
MHPDPPDFFTCSKKAVRCHAQLRCQPATRRNLLPIRALRCSRDLVICRQAVLNFEDRG